MRVVSKSRRKTAYDRSSAAFKCYQALETALELDCKKLSDLGGEFDDSSHKHMLTEIAVGNQDLYLSIAQTTIRIICLASTFVSFFACVYFWNKRKQFDELGWDWAMDKWGYWDQGYQYTIYLKNSIGMLLLSLLVALINFIEYHSLRFCEIFLIQPLYRVTCIVY